jgi:hypothetical protein
MVIPGPTFCGQEGAPLPVDYSETSSEALSGALFSFYYLFLKKLITDLP